MIKNPSTIQFYSNIQHLSLEQIADIEVDLSNQISLIANKINSNKYRLLIDDSIIKVWVEVKNLNYDDHSSTWSITFKGNPDFTKILSAEKEVNLLSKIDDLIDDTIKSYR